MTILSLSSCSPLDTKSVYLQEPGILIEPKGIILHHDDVFHTTIVIKLDSVLPESRKDIFSNCKQHIARADLKKDCQQRTASIIQNLPKNNFDVQSSTCVNPSTGCGLTANKSNEVSRSRRFAGFPIAATIFGVVSLGMGVYTY